LPTVLIRTPYGRAGLVGNLLARPLAERGFQVLIQSTRGTFGSGGEFDPFRRERNDGLDTLDWVIKQPWFGGSIVLYGPSYMGHVQWAVADRLPPEVKAMIPSISESALTREFLRHDGFSLEVPFRWGVQVALQERRWALLRLLLQSRQHHRAAFTLPLNQSDVAAMRHRFDYMQNVLTHDADSPHWDALDNSRAVGEITVPVSSIASWYDIFLPGQLRDHRALDAAGRGARLAVGPWTHMSLGVESTALNEALTFGLAHAHGEQPPDRAPVRLFVMGEERWRDFPSWPPPGYHPQRLHLQPRAGLSSDALPESDPDGYR
jgi:uncharacterized protein